MAFLGSYADLPSCQNAIREIFLFRANPPGQRLPELNESINSRISIQKEYLCLPNKKG
jgi:hypothetical protein